MDISVCICSYLRPDLLRRTLAGVAAQVTEGQFRYQVIVCDNDPLESARTIVEELASEFSTALIYCVEPNKGIADARNTALQHAGGDLIAFIDDDEIPSRKWLLELYRTLNAYPAVTAVLGPVRPRFDSDPPRWIVRGRLCERPEHATGTLLSPKECRTGNVLLKCAELRRLHPIFRPEFITGSDADFFLRLGQQGCRFMWCSEAVVEEVVLPSRWRRRFMLKRGLLRGAHHQGPISDIGRSLVAVPGYLLILPILQLFGHHHFMKYSIKLCDHLGRLLKVFNIRPVSEREV